MMANYAGSFWTSLMGIMFVPLYIKFMGIEAYGLVGVFASLLAFCSVLDFGLSATMTREMARLAATDPTGREARELTRTLEYIYWSIAVILGVITAALAGPIADHWLKPNHLTHADVKLALRITGAVIALQWPASFYAGGLNGLNCQPLLNLIQGFCATFRAVGAIFVLWLISPTIEAFFAWQIISSAIQTGCLCISLWLSIPGIRRSIGFKWSRLRRVWRFSAGMTGITLAVLLLTQMDKIILSKMLPLELFGYYTLAWTIAYMVLRTIGPIGTAVYPTLTHLVEQRNESGLVQLYHKSAQIQAALLVPATLVLVLFGDAFLWLWSNDTNIVTNTGPVMGVLAVGTCLYGFMQIPQLTMLAYGWTSLILYQTGISAIVLLPLIVLLARWYQGIGAAYVWLSLNFGYVSIMIYIMHRRVLKGEKWNWYIYDIGLPTLAALLTSLTFRILMPAQLSMVSQAIYVLAAAGFSCLAALLASEFPREKLLETGRIVLRQMGEKTF